MSIRLGTSITRWRRAYDRRLRGVGAASDATKTDPSSGGLAGGKKNADASGSRNARRRGRTARERAAYQTGRVFLNPHASPNGPAGQRRPVALLNVPEDTRFGKA